MTPPLKRLFYAGILVQLLLLALALHFYQERTAFIDIAYHLFEMTRKGDFAVQNHRFAAMATQWLPLLGIKAGWSLDLLMRLYSIAFPLLYLIVYLACGALRQPRIALAYLLAQLLLVTDTFYWIQSELPQGLAFLALLLAVLQAGAPRGPAARALFLLALPLLAVTVAFAHPLLLFPMLFALAFLGLRAPRAQRRTYVLTALLYLGAVAVKAVFFKTPYDSGAFGGLKNFAVYFPNYFTLYANKRLLLYSLDRYLPLALGAVLVAGSCIRHKEWLKLGLFAAYSSGYLLLVHVCYPGPETQDFYIENMYLPLAFFVALPLVLDVLPRWRAPLVLPVLASALAVFALVRIYRQQEPYSRRLAWMKTFLAEHRLEKLLTGAGAEDKQVLMMTWGTPYEFWLLSTSTSAPTASILIAEDPGALQWITGEPADVFIPTWGLFPYRELPPRYFRFADSLNRYRRLEP